MAVIHISEADAARDFVGLLGRVRAGAEVVIDDVSPSVVLRAVERPLRRLSESLRLAQEHGSTVTLDGGLAQDIQTAIASHPEALESAWD